MFYPLRLLSFLALCFFLLIPAFSFADIEPKLKQTLEKVFDDPNIQQVRPLSGGMTNHNYAVQWQDKWFSVRIGRNNPEELNIDRKREVKMHQIASYFKVAPKILFVKPKEGVLISWYIPGKTLNSEDVKSPETMRKIIKLVKKYQKFTHKVESENSMIAYLEKYQTSLQNKHIDLETVFPGSMDRARAAYQAIPQFEKYVLTHSDLFSRNIMEDKGRLWIVDWESANWREPWFDLSCLAAEDFFNIQQMDTLFHLFDNDVSSEKLKAFHRAVALRHYQTALWYLLQKNEVSEKVYIEYLAEADKHVSWFYKLT